MNKENLVYDTLKKFNLEGYNVVRSLPQGMSNYTYLLEKDGKLFVFRIPPENSKKYVNREREQSVINFIQNNDLTSHTVFFDEKTGVKLSAFIEGKVYNYIVKLKTKELKTIFKQLHKMYSLPLPSDVAKINMIDEINRLVKTKKNYDAKLDKYISLAKLLFDKYLQNDEKIIHGDLQLANIVFSKKNTYFLDFEFTGIANYNFDLASLYTDLMPYDYVKLLRTFYHKKPNNEQILSFLSALLCVNLHWYVVACNKHFDHYNNDAKIDFQAVAQDFLTKITSVVAEIAKYDQR